MRVLVACEYSGRVRDAFLANGHDAMSCDLLPTEVPGPHYQGDVRDILEDGWDLMVGHPDCTYLCRAGERWLNHEDDDRPGKLKGAPRWVAMWEAVAFFQELQAAPVPLIALENPRPNAKVRPHIGVPTQVVHPWQFGDTEQKATGLWLKGLPPLLPTNDVKAQMMALPLAQRTRVHRMPPGPDRWKERSRTFPGIATAMARQWGAL